MQTLAYRRRQRALNALSRAALLHDTPAVIVAVVAVAGFVLAILA